MNTPSVYTDFQGLAALKTEARGNSREALEQVAKQFESIFMQMMLKGMREGKLAEGIFDSSQSEMYQGMFDNQLAVSLSEKGGGLGIADMLIRQLQHSVPAAEGGKAERQEFAVPERNRALNAERSQPHATAQETKTAVPETRAQEPGASDSVEAMAADPVRFESPEDFIKHLWPHAQRAAKELGADPRALLAQAALETGWGKAVIRRPDGGSSHNLFNIKADHRWDGERVSKQTLEYRDGLPERERASFRAYDSYAESFDNFADFLQSSPRYQEALQVADDPTRFVEALQEAGYATDPAYARKINRIIGGQPMRDSLAALAKDVNTTADSPSSRA